MNLVRAGGRVEGLKEENEDITAKGFLFNVHLPVIKRLFTHAHSCRSLPEHLISALTSPPASSLTTGKEGRGAEGDGGR